MTMKSFPDIADKTIYADYEERIFKEPIGPIYTDEARPLIEARVLDTVRVALYDPERFEAQRAELIKQITGQYMDGFLRIPYDPDAENLDVMLEEYADREIEALLLQLEPAADKELFEIHRDSITMMAGQLKNMRGERDKVKYELSEKKIAWLQTREFLKTVLPEEMIKIADAKMGVEQLLHGSAEGEDRPIDIYSDDDEVVMSTDEKFQDIVHGPDVRRRMLQTTGIIQPPETREVEIAAEKQNAA